MPWEFVNRLVFTCIQQLLGVLETEGGILIAQVPSQWWSETTFLLNNSSLPQVPGNTFLIMQCSSHGTKEALKMERFWCVLGSRGNSLNRKEHCNIRSQTPNSETLTPLVINNEICPPCTHTHTWPDWSRLRPEVVVSQCSKLDYFNSILNLSGKSVLLFWRLLFILVFQYECKPCLDGWTNMPTRLSINSQF